MTGSVQAARASVDGGCGFETIASLPRNFDFLGEEPPDGAEAGRVVDLCRRGAGAGAPLLALVALVDEAGLPLEHRVYEARNGTRFRAARRAHPDGASGIRDDTRRRAVGSGSPVRERNARERGRARAKPRWSGELG